MNLDLHELKNLHCKLCTNKETRNTDNLGVCLETCSALDSKPVRCIGDWGRSKIYYLTQYFGIFSQGMKNKFSGKLAYIEICSGPGRCICRENGNEIDGTPLAIIQHPSFDFLSKAYFLDYSEKVIATLTERIAKIGATNKAKAFVGNYKDIRTLDLMIEELPKNGLSLVFIDPTDCSVPFSTVSYIANKLGRVDFLINVAIYSDAARNFSNIVNRHYDKTKYNNFLGSNFFDRNEIIELIKEGKTQEVRNRFKEDYKDSLKKIGYQHFDLKKISSYYDLLYASKNKRGLEFWQKASRYDPFDQKQLDLGV